MKGGSKGCHSHSTALPKQRPNGWPTHVHNRPTWRRLAGGFAGSGAHSASASGSHQMLPPSTARAHRAAATAPADCGPLPPLLLGGLLLGAAWRGGSRRSASTSPRTQRDLASSCCRWAGGSASALRATTCSAAAASSGVGSAPAACRPGCRRQAAALHAGHSVSAWRRHSAALGPGMCCRTAAWAAAQAASLPLPLLLPLPLPSLLLLRQLALEAFVMPPPLPLLLKCCWNRGASRQYASRMPCTGRKQ